MSDPFWDDLDKALPRARRGEPGWEHQRGKVLALLRGQARAPRRLAGLLAAGTVTVALAFVLRDKPAPDAPPTAAMPSDELDFLEETPLLEHLDQLQDAPELDHT
ncbi:MAG: hypothetical protein AAB036_10850 [Elusimicrobiota bacterium]